MANTQVEALKLALEALEKLFGIEGDVAVWRLGGSYRAQQAITAIKAALKAKDEPVALKMDVIVVNLVREGINKHRARELAEHFIKHTTTPPQQEAKDEKQEPNKFDLMNESFEREEANQARVREFMRNH